MSSYLVAIRRRRLRVRGGLAGPECRSGFARPPTRSILEVPLEATPKISSSTIATSPSVPLRQIGHAGGSDFASRHGEHGHLLPKPACWPTGRRLRWRRAETSRRRSPARWRIVVRRSRHDAVVGRHLAERRVRNLDDQSRPGRLEGGVGYARRRRRSRIRQPSASTRCGHQGHPRPRGDAGRDRGSVRHDHLPERCGCSEDDRALHGRRRLP